MLNSEWALSAKLIEAVLREAEQISAGARGEVGVFIELYHVAHRHFPTVARDFELSCALPEGVVAQWVNGECGGVMRANPKMIDAYARQMVRCFETQLEHYKG